MNFYTRGGVDLVEGVRRSLPTEADEVVDPPAEVMGGGAAGLSPVDGGERIGLLLELREGVLYFLYKISSSFLYF